MLKILTSILLGGSQFKKHFNCMCSENINIFQEILIFLMLSHISIKKVKKERKLFKIDIWS